MSQKRLAALSVLSHEVGITADLNYEAILKNKMIEQVYAVQETNIDYNTYRAANLYGILC